MVYSWQGRHTSNLEAGSSVLRATEMHTAGERAGRSTLVRVVEHQEPTHFTSLFK